MVNSLAQEIDWKKVTEYSQFLEELEQLKARKAKLFDPKQLVAKTTEIKTAYDPEFGVINFGSIVAEELTEINRLQTNEEKGVYMLYLALHKAYPDVKLEDIEGFCLEDFTRLMKLIFGAQVFFQTQQPSENGSKARATFKGSGS